ncbi:hypothetical protein Nepgr_033004 [Nepenthes gracilis]|uniref:Uncharacterized protein n=1 Tax=Nepenthes gracilis TaxID=150966 RepID=A0AAD3TLB5_NEPGR|nr:hypothetical protein Nepgr_033004 [Nepenthes gracilis]
MGRQRRAGGAAAAVVVLVAEGVTQECAVCHVRTLWFLGSSNLKDVVGTSILRIHSLRLGGGEEYDYHVIVGNVKATRRTHLIPLQELLFIFIQ